MYVNQSQFIEEIEWHTVVNRNQLHIVECPLKGLLSHDTQNRKYNVNEYHRTAEMGVSLCVTFSEETHLARNQIDTVSLGKSFSSKGEQLYKHQATETQSHN